MKIIDVDLPDEDDEDEEQDTREKQKYRNKEFKVNIKDLFSPEEQTETTSEIKMICPDCGMQGGRTEGFILFKDSNTAYCHSSGKHFRMLEAYALKKKIIRCLDGRETGDNSSKILGGELFTLTLTEFKNEYGTEKYNELIEDLNIRKSIELPGNNRYVSDFAEDIGDIYKSRNVLFFREESREVIEIGRYEKINNEGKLYVENGFITVDGSKFVTLAEMFVKPWTTLFTKAGQKLIVNKSMTESQSSLTLKSQNLQDKIPKIARIFDIQIPIIYKGKLTFPKKGYDAKFRSWLPYNAPQIKEGLYTLEESKVIINSIFEEFCFATEKDRTHAIAAFITPFLRGLFPSFSTRTPVFIYMANRERAGKDYCAGCNGILYEGSDTQEPAISNDEKGSSNEEIRKKIAACLLQGKKRFHSANNKGLLNNSIFEGVTTSTVWNDRILGKSKNIKFNNEMDFSLSGNLGIKLTPDLANRSRIINLHLVDEDANARVFKNPRLHEWILDNRELIVSALYVIVKNWVDKGMPKGTIPFTSFPYWADICGGIMEAAGYDNPCSTDNTAIISLDGETEEMKILYETCYDKRPNDWITKKEIQSIAETEGIMHYLDFTKIPDKIKFGIKIDKYHNRILSDILMQADNIKQRADRRKYKFSKVITFCNSNPITFPNETNEVFDTKKVENEGDNELGRVGIVWEGLYVSSTVTKENIESNIEPLQRIPTLPEFLPNLDKKDEKPQNFQTFEDFTKKYKDFKKSEDILLTSSHRITGKKKKEKTDRELQFWESPETKFITEQCTQKQVLEWIRNNPGNDFKMMDKDLGNGCFKYRNKLLKEGFIRPFEKGWEIINDIKE
jgi:hypothetical protein